MHFPLVSFFFVFVLRFLLRKLSDLIAVFVFLLTWVFQDKPYAISTPRYLALAAASMVLTYRVYVVGRGERDLVMCITWHLLGLNCISHLISHT